MSEEAAKALDGPDFDRVVKRLLDRLMELESEKVGGDSAEASRGWNSNQLDARGNKGGIWYVVESRWSIVAIAVACVALGIAIMTSSTVVVQLMESRRELAREERLKINAVDDLRMEMRAVLREAGVQSEVPENTDISQLAEKAMKGAPHVPK